MQTGQKILIGISIVVGVICIELVCMSFLL